MGGIGSRRRSRAAADTLPTRGATPRRGVGVARHVRRYTEIVGILVRYGFVDVVDALHLRPPLAAGRRALALFGGRPRATASRAVRLRLAFEAMGPVFIKFGQALSARADLLPADVVAELALLQDAVPPLAPGVAEAAIEAALGRPVDALFARFEPVPLAAASIAQVHRATLASGETVAVKVRRPGLDAIVEADLAILADLAALAERHWADAPLYSLGELVAEFARTIRREQDLVREGRLVERVASQFAGDATVRLPRIVWPLSRPGVLTMEFLDGVKVSAVGTSAAPGLDARVVARRGADAVLTQILVHGLFHADPHPGNLLVLPGNVVAFIDFGIVGRIDAQLRDRLADMILAVHGHDAERLAALVVDVATPLQPVAMTELARDIDEMLDLHSGVPLGQLSLRALFAAITDTMARHRLRLPADLLLLIKAVTTIEAVGRQLDPAFEIVGHATPFVTALIEQKRGPRALARRMAHAGHDALGAVRTLPGNLAAIATRIRADGLQVQFVHRNLDFLVREMDRSSNRVSFSVVIAAVVIGSSIIIHADAQPQIDGYPVLGLAGFLVAGVLGVGLAIGILRSGRL